MIKTPSIEAVLIKGESQLEQYYKNHPKAKIVDVDWKIGEDGKHYFLVKREVMVEKE